jgi:hypothetical protein
MAFSIIANREIGVPGGSTMHDGAPRPFFDA